MNLTRVAITGADRSIRPEQLVPLSQQYPFVEWAILLSENNVGYRYPDGSWLRDLRAVQVEHNLKLAGHICGSWVRDLVTHRDARVFDMEVDHGVSFLEMFPRIQLNFSPYHAYPSFLDILQRYPENQFIFQIGSKGIGEKKALLQQGLDMGLRLAVLFDRSGGKGILPKSWPEPLPPFYCGYAGGLGPESLDDQLLKIAEVVEGHRVWVDMESKVRSEDDSHFDLEKVAKCLEICRPWVKDEV